VIAVTTKTIVRELAIDRLDCDIRHRGEWLCSTRRLVWHPGGVVGNHEPAVAALLVNLRLDDGKAETLTTFVLPSTPVTPVVDAIP
jgi:hypothetical protein